MVAGGNLDCDALLMLYSATMVSMSALANFKASNLSFCFILTFEGPGNEGKTTYTKSDGTSPLCLTVSLIALNYILRIIRSGRNW